VTFSAFESNCHVITCPTTQR